MRDLKRIYRLHGLRPFAWPLMLFLGFAVVLDGQWRTLDEAMETQDRLEKQARQMRAKLGQRVQLEQNLKERQAELASSGDLLLGIADPAQARQTAVVRLDQALQSARAQSVAVTPLSEDIEGEAILVKTEASFTTVPRQLVGGLAALKTARPAARVDRLEIAVPDATERQLMVNIRISSVASLPPTSSGTKK